MNIPRLKKLMFLTVVAGALTVTPEWAVAGESASCEILEIRASKEKGGVDPALRKLAKKLSKPPFDSWSSFRLLAKHSKPVERMKSLVLSLKAGGRLSLLYRDQSKAPGKKTRLRLSFTLDDASGKRILDMTLKLDSGDTNLIAGGRLPGGALHIVATACTAK